MKQGITRDAVAAFAAKPGRKAFGLVLDLRRTQEVAEVAARVDSQDARAAIVAAAVADFPYIVLAGQLHKPKAGAYIVMLREEASVPFAMEMAFDRMTDAGADDVLWILILDDAMTRTCSDALAMLSVTEGSA